MPSVRKQLRPKTARHAGFDRPSEKGNDSTSTLKPAGMTPAARKAEAALPNHEPTPRTRPPANPPPILWATDDGHRRRRPGVSAERAVDRRRTDFRSWLPASSPHPCQGEERHLPVHV